MEVMIYGDGAFKDPVARFGACRPCSTPAFTSDWKEPNEKKLKYIADNNFAHLREKN